MDVNEVDAHIHEYLVSLYLLKAIERDRKHLAAMKMQRFWDAWFERISIAAERYHVSCRKMLRAIGCRIVLEEILESKHIHVMYVYRHYEYHFYVMPMVLKARCEERLKILCHEAQNACTD